MGAQLKHQVETTYINAWVESGAYTLVINSTVATQMRRLKLDLVDINFVLQTGTVVRSDMIDRRGLWNVRGLTADDITLTILIAVTSSVYEVEVLRVVRAQRRET